MRARQLDRRERIGMLLENKNTVFSDDGNTMSGAWGVYPGGGGYDSTATRVK